MKNYNIVVESIVGISFLAVISICLRTKKPQYTAILFIPIIIGLFIYMSNNFPQLINELRKIKQQKEKYSNEDINSVSKELKSIKKNIYP